MDLLVAKYKDKIGDGLTFELDFSSNVSTYASDLLITDWSGIGLEFSFATLKPALFINTKMKMENPHYDKIGLVPQEIQLRSQLGVALNKEQLDQTAQVVRNLLKNQDYHDEIKAIRERYFYHFGSNGSFGGEYIVDRLTHKR